ncbi:heme-binding protein, partial [Streptomyces sp. NPDC001274]
MTAVKHARKTSTRTRVVIGGTVAGAVALGTFAVVNANAGSAGATAVVADAVGGNLQQSTHLTLEAASRAAQATLDAAKKENQRVS